MAEYAAIDATGEATAARQLTADEYEAWVDWINPDTGAQLHPAVGGVDPLPARSGRAGETFLEFRPGHEDAG